MKFTQIAFIRNEKSLLKTQQRNKSERYNVFTVEIHKIEQYTYGTSKDILREKEDIKWSNIIKRCKKWLTPQLIGQKIGHMGTF